MINQKRLLKTFFDLVKIDSPSSCEKCVALFVQKELKKLGLTTKKDRHHNVIAKFKGKKPGYLALSGHLDTVEPGCGIRPIIKKDKIVSEGETVLGADNKASVAAIMEAVRTIKEKNIPTPSLELLFTVSEEVGGSGAGLVSLKDLKAKRGYNFDSCKPLGRIVTCSPTYIRIDAKIKGRSAHAMAPRQGNNVLKALKDILNKMPLGQVDRYSTINIGIIKMGHIRNAVPGLIEIKGEVRSQDPAKAKTWPRKVKNIFRQAAKKYKQTLKIEVAPEHRGFVISHRDPFLKTTKKVMREMGLRGDLERIMGCSDTNVFRKRGLEVINLSNGNLKPHTTDEFIKEKDLYRLGEMIIELAKHN